jgi:hypothetical protein
MHLPGKIFALVLSTILGAVNSLCGQQLPKGDYWFSYDVHVPGSLTLCEKDTGTCHLWNPDKEFFRSGSLIRLKVSNGKFRSTFKVTVNGIVVADEVPQVRGVSSAPTPTVQTPPPTPSPTPLTLDPDPTKALGQIEKQFDDTEAAFQKAESDLAAYLDAYLGPAPATLPANCSPRVVSLPTSMVGDILGFAKQLEADAGVCDASANGDYFRNEAAFNNLTDRADRLTQSVTLLNATLPAPDATAARSQWQALSAMVAAYEKKFTAAADPNRNEAITYLSSGNKYKGLLHEEGSIESKQKTLLDRVSDDMKQITASMSKGFAYINALYSISASSRTFDLPVGQYNTSYAAAFSIVEVANPVVYAVTPAKAPQANDNSLVPGANPNLPPAQIENPFTSSSGGHSQTFFQSNGDQHAVLTSVSFRLDSAAQSTAGDKNKKKSSGDKQQQDTNPGKIVYSGSFDVHKFYRANIVAGFFVSSLKNRPYGLTNNGQATSSSNITYVTVVGEPYRPQFHAFVGINIYLWERDVFPGQLSKQGPFWSKKNHGWLNGYWNPGVMVGYGVDSANNYLVGLNWEMKWGINVGGGLHIGQEAFLQPGIVPGVTQLPSTTTAPPTFNKTSYGYYGSLGFDLAVMKAALGQLFGGGSSVPSK